MHRSTSRRLDAALLLALACSLASCRPVVAPHAGAPPLDVIEMLTGDATGFERALEPRAFEFPADHGSHPEFRSEWWYVTANLRARSGAGYGVQFTLFRSATEPTPATVASAWATNQLYMAHLAVSDQSAGRFDAFDRFARGGSLELAGARTAPFVAWLEDWRLEQLPGQGSRQLPGFRLTAADQGVAIELAMQSTKPAVLQGQAGLSRKGAIPGNASYYYSLTRLTVAGRVTIDGHSEAVEGTAWLDREWGSSALEPGQVGWDWFALQLDDDTELMLYQMRRDDGSVDAASAGVLVQQDGSSVSLSSSDFTVSSTARWRSPHSGVEYPARWQIVVPSLQTRLEIRPTMSDQELRLAFRYWEGAVRVEGAVAGQQVGGVGFVEFTGYGRTGGGAR